MKTFIGPYSYLNIILEVDWTEHGTLEVREMRRGKVWTSDTIHESDATSCIYDAFKFIEDLVESHNKHNYVFVQSQGMKMYTYDLLVKLSNEAGLDINWVAVVG